MGEYGLTREQAFGEFPLASALALMPSNIERRGGKPTGPSLEQLAFIRAANTLKQQQAAPL